MSGSGNDVGGYVGPASGGDACDKLRLTRFLEGPVPDVIDGLAVGDTLSIVLRGETPPLVVAITSDGAEAGGILPTGQLIECLQRGVEYVAQVVRINDAAIELDVRAAR
ncbi:hypothetical protein [Mycolicibacterium llatzerense]|uniref:hypothetical protein n=1 Tax=Mycolicibacterium llatzerense TaxID=280871 RepID=UPI0021B58F03|nr:hypothetical protein [Mycolicibacterium llatzerense]MCT7362881.1 hypothetical protein [Mycolicibacterium llatzerense]